MEMNFMERTAVQAKPNGMQDDRYRELALRVVAGPQFARSPLLSRFLLYVVAETLEGRGDEISEHQIGVQVFDRPPDYRTLEDNIVRNYARQLRKRLAEHFADQGSAERARIDIPVGGYVPVFLPVPEVAEKKEPSVLSMHARDAAHSDLSPLSDPVSVTVPGSKEINGLRIWLLMAAYSAGLVAATWFVAARATAPRLPEEPARILWKALFGGTANSYIVPSDAGFNLIEDLSRQPQPLAQYIAGSYQNLPLGEVDAHSAEDLRSQQITPFIDLQVAAALAHLTEDDPQRVSIRFPRDLRFDDLKNANAVIIGSLGSNPWASIIESNANFRIVYRPGMNGAEIDNQKLQPGEASAYVSHWNEPSHETYALIEFLPNLSGNGHLLVLEGLDVAGTQAAAEMLFHPSAIDPILRQAMRADGSLRNFEVLLRSTSIESNATGTQVIACRIY
jgi:hypothetical protein